MAVKSEELLSINAYAKLIGVNEKSVRKAIASGKIVKGYDADKKKIIRKYADQEYGDFQSIPKAKAGVSSAKLAEKLEAQETAKKSEPKKARSEGPKSEPEKKAKSEPEPENIEFEEYDQSYEELIKRLKIHSGLTHKEVLRRREIISAALDKKKLEESEEILVRRDVVERVLFSFGAQLKKAILSVPVRVIDDVLAAPNKVEALNILAEELTSILNAYSDTDKVKLTNK